MQHSDRVMNFKGVISVVSQKNRNQYFQ